MLAVDWRWARCGALVAVALGAIAGCGASDGSLEPGNVRSGAVSSPRVVSHVTVVSDKVPDVSSLSAWRRSFLSGAGAPSSDADKAMVVWRSVVAFRHQDEPPREYLESTGHVHDPIKLFNVYGYCQCDCASAAIEALGREAGLTVRGRLLDAHSVPEVRWDDAWHMLDGAFVDWFPGPDQSPVSVDDLLGAVGDFYARNPGYLGNAPALATLRASGAWRTIGPPLLGACPFFDAKGLYPDRIHGWDTAMRDYDGAASEIVEYPYTLGYEVNVQLRPGERLVRNWGNRGLHVNAEDGLACDSLDATVGQGELAYTPAYGDLANGRVGNGTIEYEAPLDDPRFLPSALVADNLVAGNAPARVRIDRGGAPGRLVLRMPSSYVYLGARLDLEARIGAGGHIDVRVSDDNGLAWKDAGRVSASGAASIDLSALVARRYDYRVELVLAGAGTGIGRLHLASDIQHSQRALPALGLGDNTITFGAGPDQGTLTVEGSTNPDDGAHQLTYRDFAPLVDGLADAPLQLTGATGAITFPVETPGPITRLRFGGTYRARDATDGWDLGVSFDGGASFRAIDRMAGPAVLSEKWVTVDDVPPDTRRALVRYSGTQRNTTELFDFRIDADYAEPAGGFRPVRITYEWDEDGASRSDVHVATRPRETYVIHCDGTPRMKSLALELAQ